MRTIYRIIRTKVIEPHCRCNPGLLINYFGGFVGSTKNFYSQVRTTVHSAIVIVALGHGHAFAQVPAGGSSSTTSSQVTQEVMLKGIETSAKFDAISSAVTSLETSSPMAPTHTCNVNPNPKPQVSETTDSLANPQRSLGGSSGSTGSTGGGGIGSHFHFNLERGYICKINVFKNQQGKPVDLPGYAKELKAIKNTGPHCSCDLNPTAWCATNLPTIQKLLDSFLDQKVDLSAFCELFGISPCPGSNREIYNCGSGAICGAVSVVPQDCPC